MLLGVMALLCFAAVVNAAVREGLALVGEHRASVGAVATLAVAAVLPDVLGRFVHDVVFGALATAVLALWPAFRYARRRVRGPVFVDEDALSPAHALSYVLFAVVLALGLWCAWTTFLWDEDSTHFGLSSLIARGGMPPEQPYFPGERFRYHIGYDVLVAVVKRATDLRIDACCDVVTTVCLAILLWIARDAGRALGGARAGALAVVLVLLGYGPGAACLAQGWLADVGRCDAWFPSSWIGATTMPPAEISSFLQHPQGLGMPIALAAILVAAGGPVVSSSSSSSSSSPRWESTARVGASAVLAALLAQAQTVFFALTGVALGAAVLVLCVDDVRAAGRAGAGPRAAILHALARLGLLACAGAAGFALGGVLQGGGAVDAIHFGAGYFDDGTVAALLAHDVALFGFGFIAPFIAVVTMVVRVRAGRGAALPAALAAASLAGFFIGDFARYENSWDIVKFFSAACLFGNALFAAQLAWLFRGGGGGAAAHVVRVCAGLAILALSTWSASLWLVRHGPLNGVIAPVYAEQPPDRVGVVLWDAHRKDIARDDRILTTHDDIAQLGFLVVGRERRRGGSSYLLDARRVAHEADVRKRIFPRLSEADLDALRVSFVLVTEREAIHTPALDDGARFVRLLPDVVVNGAHWRLFKRREVSE